MTSEGFIALLGVATVAASSLAYRLLYRPMRLTMDTLVEQIGNLREMLKNAQSDIEAERANRKKEVENARTEVQQARDETKQTRDEAQQARDEAQRIRDEAQKLRDDLSALSEKHEASEAERKKTAEEMSILREGFDRSETRREELATALDKQKEQHDADLTAINEKTAEQLAKMQLETSSVKDLYKQVQEDQQRQGREIMELNIKLDNARNVLRRWGLSPEQIEGLLSGILDPALVETIVSQELLKHLTPVSPAEPPVESPTVPISAPDIVLSPPASITVTSEIRPDGAKIEVKTNGADKPPEEKSNG